MKNFKFEEIYDLNEKLLYNENKITKETELKKLKKDKYLYHNYSAINLIEFEKGIFEDHDFLNDYIEESGKKFRHWLSTYTYLKNTNHGFYENIFKNVGKFICENFSNEKIQKFIYHSTFYKCIAIEYAYSTGQNKLAKQIIYLGYDRYFELETFYLMKKYDEKLFYQEIKEVKKICLKRILKNHFKGIPVYSVEKLYGNEFAYEFYKLAKQTIKKLKTHRMMT